VGSTLGKGESPNTEGQRQGGKRHTLFMFWVGDRAYSEKLAKKKAILWEAGILLRKGCKSHFLRKRRGENT